MSSRYGVGILGNCCTHGEFVAFALKQELASICRRLGERPCRANGLSVAIGLELVSSPEALLDDSTVDIVALACSPHEKAAWAQKAA